MGKRDELKVHEVRFGTPVPFSHTSTSANGRKVPQIRVGAQSIPGDVAGAITEAIKREQACEVTMIGPPAINQGVKALAITRGHLASLNLDLILRPAFFNTHIDGKEITGVMFAATTLHL